MASPPEHVNDIPSWLQMAVSAALLLAGGLSAVLGYTRKNLGQRRDEQSTQDAVVISAAFADSKVINHMTEMLRDLDDAIDRMNDTQNRQIDAQGRITDALNRLGDIVNRQFDELRKDRK